MAVGDEAVAAGYPLVPDTGEEGKVKWGAREINRTRDYIAALKARFDRMNFNGRITISNQNPSGGSNGDIWFKWS